MLYDDLERRKRKSDVVLPFSFQDIFESEQKKKKSLNRKICIFTTVILCASSCVLLYVSKKLMVKFY